MPAEVKTEVRTQGENRAHAHGHDGMVLSWVALRHNYNFVLGIGKRTHQSAERHVKCVCKPIKGCRAV